jgi:hypothetical protein
VELLGIVATLAQGSRAHTDKEPREERKETGQRRAGERHRVLLLDGLRQQETDNPDEAAKHPNREYGFKGHRTAVTLDTALRLTVPFNVGAD